MENKLFTNRIFMALLLACGTFSCEDFVQVDLPNSQISSEIVFENDDTAIAAAAGMYSTMLDASSFIGEFHPLSYLGGLSSDELVDYSGIASYNEFYGNQLTINNSTVLSLWRSLYKTIYEANAVIEGVTSSSSISIELQRQLEGEGKFIRAFCHFYLINLFADVPLATSTDYRENSTLSRTPIADVYRQVKSDLEDAKNLLPEDYFLSDKIRPNKWAATALLARIYLYSREYEKAESEASELIESSAYSLSDISEVFLANSSESILQLSQVYPYGFPTADAANFILAGFTVTAAVSNDLINSFEADDLRLSKWLNSFDGTNYYPAKYKVYVYFSDANYPENLVLLRLAEQYLIRAEARMERSDIPGAQSDLNIIRNRAGLANTGANDQASLRLAIEQERRFEFFCEMGHRWLDLKRTERTDEVLGPIKTSWNTTDGFYPIPEQEILNNPKLVPQNEGY